MIRRPPRSTLFPYRRSSDLRAGGPNCLAGLFVESVKTIGGRALRSPIGRNAARHDRSEEHTSELQSLTNLVCRLLLEKKKKKKKNKQTVQKNNEIVNKNTQD